MCGILGYFGGPGYAETVDDKLPLIHHRGPDGNGSYADRTENYHVGLGHTRLSIIDLNERANQPFSSTDGRYKIVYNGEIYNYRELQSKLEGYDFQTTSDTEVLLQLYIRYGKEMLDWLMGMFAFCIYDQQAGKIFCARDPLGIKPFYYYADDNKFVFGSEIKTLFAFRDVPRTMDPQCFTEFLLNRYLYEPDTGFKNVYKLPSGHYLEARVEGGRVVTQTEPYWTLESRRENITQEEIEAMIRRSIDLHMVSDVPVGLFFSGGIDSSLVLQQLKEEIAPFVVKSDAQHYKQSGFANDYDYARQIAGLFGVKLNELEVAEAMPADQRFFEAVDQLSLHTEEMLSDYTFHSSQLIAAKSRAAGYKVMQSGMGADEIFAGYSRYEIVKHAAFYKGIRSLVNLFFSKSKFFEKRVHRFNAFFNYDDFRLKYTALITHLSIDMIRDLLGDHFDMDAYLAKLQGHLDRVGGKLTPMKKAMALDMKGFLIKNFMYVDKSSMLESQELRVPLATKELAQLAFSMDDSRLLTLKETKIPLRKILLKDLPKKVVNRKKVGFTPPMDNIVTNLGKAPIQQFFTDKKVYDILRPAPLNQLLDDHFSGKRNNTYKILEMLYFASWTDLNR